MALIGVNKATKELAEDAKRIIEVLEKHKYRVDNTDVDISDIKEPILYTDEEMNYRSRHDIVPKRIGKDTVLSVNDMSVVEAIWNTEANRLGVLNFASAHRPGGGFVNGEYGQEEELCHCSTLYSQLAHSHMYEDNLGLSSGMNNDTMTATDTLFFRDNSWEFKAEPKHAIVVSSTAVNSNAIKDKRDRMCIEYMMKNRMTLITRLFIENKCDAIILGAYGCGFFGNDPYVIASIWRGIIRDYGGYFKNIVFAIPDDKDNNFATFKEVLGK